MFVQILGVIFVLVGIALVIKNEWFIQNFGRIEWAERKLAGGTRAFLKILGPIIIFVGFMMIFNLFGGFVEWVFSPLIRRGQQ